MVSQRVVSSWRACFARVHQRALIPIDDLVGMLGEHLGHGRLGRRTASCSTTGLLIRLGVQQLENHHVRYSVS